MPGGGALVSPGEDDPKFALIEPYFCGGAR